ncbi:UDP-N-acetylmuramate dehydrogenase [Vibrio methylphosphonaticus]|uniref:UDP-N-acetylmuramate dehydrogenase n=1 Tax=Vibrio methylphosphonaticus TaxID=2946866 RepID=UPI00202A8C98|nr:UDP-N-acetylmuramate dehydrogenase [Vibrio methylphosphonaticus]MCL9777314.1 UDP-N-acetylmuramate dehydrogenase [Vibrio methylphosphonaticus]
MQTEHNAQLSPFHTFAISQTCQQLVTVTSVDDLVQAYQVPAWAHLPKLMLGKGSNVLFTEHFDGIVMVNQLMGITHSSSEDHHHLHIAGGEDWPQLVAWCVEQGYAGLENLALIPGCAGSAPIQNIGAYGLEFKDVCEYVDYLCLDSYKVKRLKRSECEFGYRDSIFKKALHNKAIVVAVGLKLEKHWQPNLSYGPLQRLDPKTCTAREVFDIVVQVRQEKLPDPSKIGNAGSFFKNPVVCVEKYQHIKQQHPDIIAYPFEGKMKLAAGWLIDQCGLKGTCVGGAMVHPNQALVLVNAKSATAQDVTALATMVRQRVLDKFSVELEHEVRFMGRRYEITLKELL